jgi:5'-methylthioadenosine phosphorylase
LSTTSRDMRGRTVRKARIAVISGTGFEIFMPEEGKTRIGTPYGPSAPIFMSTVASREVVFLKRHGDRHSIPPHKINYRANIWALHSLGVERVLASNGVGAINRDFRIGDLIVPSDFIDFTKMRASTFFDEAPVTHIDVSNVYCRELREVLIDAAERRKFKVWKSGIYLCTDGPRYESPAEISMFRGLGCDVVGMTGLPEVVLAHEIGMCYASLCYVTNMAADTSYHIIAEDVALRGKEMGLRIKDVFSDALEAAPRKRDCNCSESLEGARI